MGGPAGHLANSSFSHLSFPSRYGLNRNLRARAIGRKGHLHMCPPFGRVHKRISPDGAAKSLTPLGMKRHIETLFAVGPSSSERDFVHTLNIRFEEACAI